MPWESPRLDAWYFLVVPWACPSFSFYPFFFSLHHPLSRNLKTSFTQHFCKLIREVSIFLKKHHLGVVKKSCINSIISYCIPTLCSTKLTKKIARISRNINKDINLPNMTISRRKIKEILSNLRSASSR